MGAKNLGKLLRFLQNVIEKSFINCASSSHWLKLTHVFETHPVYNYELIYHYVIT
jgi:hypothetical protein